MNQTKVSSSRRYDFDWLRVLLILTVFVFHSTRFFDLDGWHVKNADTYMGVQILVVFISRWMMPAIFLISGVATFFALGKHGAGRFVRDRALRLLVPLLVGLFTHTILQGYLEAVSQRGFTGTFWQFYAGSFHGLAYFGGTFNWTGNHLWYLEILFVFSLLCLPLFIWLLSNQGKRVLDWLGNRFAAPWSIYLMAVPTLLLLFLINQSNPTILETDSFGGWNLPNHLYFFLSGFLLASSEKMQSNILRLRWVSLIAGVVMFVVGGGLYVTFGDVPFGSPMYYLLNLFNGLMPWTWMLAFLGFARQYLARRTPLLDYANEAVLPFYIFHQTVLLLVGFFVVNWAVPDLAKWAIIAPSSFLLIMGLYELLVRRINPVRFLFGMKPVQRDMPVHKPAVQVS